MNLEKEIEDIIEKREGGFVDHPADRGGPTKFGITQATLSRYLGRPVTRDDVKSLSRELAEEIYEQCYYYTPRIDKLPEDIQHFVFDSAINHGPKNAVKMVQDVINQIDGMDSVARDGIIGPRTISAANQAQELMGPVLLKALVEQRRMLYKRIVSNDPSQEVFLRGWLNRLKVFT